MEKRKICSLIPGVSRRATFKRSDGKTYCLLNSEFMVEVVIHENGDVIGNGTATRVNPNEEVELICDGLPATAGGPIFRSSVGAAY